MIWRRKKGKPVELHTDSPILEAPPKQWHWSPAIGDRIKNAWNKVRAGSSLDGNLTPGCGHIWFLHWSTAKKNGYLWVIDARSGRIRRMSRLELRRSLDKWGYDGVKRWRDKHGQAPMTLREGLKYLTDHHILGALEPKGSAWGRNPIWFQMFYSACKTYDHPAWAKRIATLRLPKATVINAHKANVQIAAIYGKGVKGRIRRRAHTARMQRGWGKVHFDATW